MMRVESWVVSPSSTRTGSDFCPVIQRTRGTWKPGRSERRTCAMPFQSSAQRAFSLKCEKRNCQRTGGAVAHALLVTIYHVVARETAYTERGAAYFDARHAERVTQRAVQALERQGY